MLPTVSAAAGDILVKFAPYLLPDSTHYQRLIYELAIGAPPEKLAPHIAKLSFPENMLGMIGVMIGVLFLMLHLFSLESFGRPYMAPLAPFRAGEWKDTVLRASWKTLQRRHNGRGGRA